MHDRYRLGIDVGGANELTPAQVAGLRGFVDRAVARARRGVARKAEPDDH